MLYCIVGAPVGEELLFRGVSLFIALTYTGHALVLLAVGNLVWAYLHVVLGDADHTLPRFVGGFLEVFLWLHGLGLLAIALHAWNNLFVYSVIYAKKLARRVHPRIFTRGEEHLVVIEPAPPSMRGLYRGQTADGRRVHVADGIPETACWVRIVHGGFIASGYPCSRPDGSEN